MDNDNEHINDNIWHTKFLSQVELLQQKWHFFFHYQCWNTCVCVCFNNDNNTEISFKNEISLKNKNPHFGFQVFNPINYIYIYYDKCFLIMFIWMSPCYNNWAPCFAFGTAEKPSIRQCAHLSFCKFSNK